MHSSSVWVQELKPKSHGWLYIMAIRGLSSSDKDKPLHYAVERIFLRGQFKTQHWSGLCGVSMCCLCLCGFPAGDSVHSHSPDICRWTQLQFYVSLNFTQWIRSLVTGKTQNRNIQSSVCKYLPATCYICYEHQIDLPVVLGVLETITPL